MTDNDSGYWKKATVWQRAHPAAAHLQALYNPAQPEQTVAPVAGGATQETVVPKHAGEFANAESPSPHMLTAEQMVSLRLGYGALPSAVTPTGLRDPARQEAAHIAAASTSVGPAPMTTKNIITNGE